MTRLPHLVAALAGILAVAFGTSGAHLIRDPADKALLATAATFGLAHAAAALAVLALADNRVARAVALLLAAGAVIFSIALGGLAFGGPRLLGAVAPLGGTLMLSGWVLLLARFATSPPAR